MTIVSSFKLKFIIWCLILSGHAHNESDRCIAAGYDNGDIKLFDLRNMSLRWETNIKNGVSIFYIHVVLTNTNFMIINNNNFNGYT